MILSELLKLRSKQGFEIIRVTIKEDDCYGCVIVELKGRPIRLDWNEVMGWE